MSEIPANYGNNPENVDDITFSMIASVSYSTEPGVHDGSTPVNAGRTVGFPLEVFVSVECMAKKVVTGVVGLAHRHPNEHEDIGQLKDYNDVDGAIITALRMGIQGIEDSECPDCPLLGVCGTSIRGNIKYFDITKADQHVVGHSREIRY